MLLGACGEEEDAGNRPSTPVGKENWEMFGREPSRTHYLPASADLNPPLRRLWRFSARALIEFPPAVNDGVAYLADKFGNVRAVDLSDQSVIWDIRRDGRDVGPPADVTGPAYYDGSVFVAFSDGLLVALDSGTGRVRWKRDLKSTLESSPAVLDGRLYIGNDKGYVLSIDTSDGSIDWRFRAPAPVKSSPSVSQGGVVFGDYAGNMYRVSSRSGDLVWKTATDSGGSGGFYSSPAVEYGKVFAGRDDGKVFAFDFDDGRIDWTYTTRGPIYGSPAVADAGGIGPTVYIGSYDARLYALNASDGRKRWAFPVGGPVPGTATVVGDTVYSSSFLTEESFGVDIRSRKKNFSFDSPGYTPMISDGRNLYLVGYFTLHAFEPRD
jgi:outer membrane protein assembly factor BamB